MKYFIVYSANAYNLVPDKKSYVQNMVLDEENKVMIGGLVTPTFNSLIVSRHNKKLFSQRYRYYTKIYPEYLLK